MPSNDVNVVVVEGCLCKDPQVWKSDNGRPETAVFELATNRYARGDRIVVYVKVVAFGQMSDFVDRYCRKGHRVWVQGHLRLANWVDKDTGKRRSTIEIEAEQLHFGYGPHDKREVYSTTHLHGGDEVNNAIAEEHTIEDSNPPF